MKKGDWIYWNYKNRSTPSFSYSYVDDVIETKKDGKMLHLTDGYYTNYPLRVLERDINIVEKQTEQS